MKKKIMAVTLCLAMVSTFAVGCGQKNETDSGKSLTAEKVRNRDRDIIRDKDLVLRAKDNNRD